MPHPLAETQVGYRERGPTDTPKGRVPPKSPAPPLNVPIHVPAQTRPPGELSAPEHTHPGWGTSAELGSSFSFLALRLSGHFLMGSLTA